MMSTLVFLVCVWIATIHAYPEGPPVTTHPDICQSMSPKEGHGVDPQTSEPPFEIQVLSTDNCYKHGTPLFVKLAVKSGKDTYFEGLFVQARLDTELGSEPVNLNASTYNHGTFDTYGDPKLQKLTCSGTADNAIAHRAKAHYNDKTFTWTPRTGLMDTVKFVATVVHETQKYWIGVMSPAVQYNANCQYREVTTPSPSRSTSPLPSAAALFLFVVSGLLLADW